MDEIKQYDPDFDLKKILAKKKQRKESLAHKIYDILTKYCVGWYIQVDTEHYILNDKCEAMMILKIFWSQNNKEVISALKELLHIGSNNISNEYYVRCFNESKFNSTVFEMDIDTFDIPNEIIYLHSKEKLRRNLLQSGGTILDGYGSSGLNNSNLALKFTN